MGEILEIAIWPVNLGKAFFSNSFLFKWETHHIVIAVIIIIIIIIIIIMITSFEIVHTFSKLYKVFTAFLHHGTYIL